MSVEKAKMNEADGAAGRDKTPVAARAKRPYSPPTLVVFGHVAALTQSSSGCAMDDSPPCSAPPGAMGPMLSDRRAKQNIRRVGTHPLGFGLYLFEYKAEHQPRWGTGRMFGVMADEVESTMPHAVFQHADGHKRVDY